MCGIAGIIHARGGRPDPDELQRMVAALAHRGPDDQGIHCEANVGLAQCRLSIIGLESGHQPMVEAGLALVANGEVYNYLELNAELAAQGYPACTASDSETILNAYARHGLDALRRLRGMYAFALHDARQGKLILARDRLGIKPLFYLRLPGRIAFASELKALLPLLGAEPELEAVALRRFLQHQFASGARTLVRGIDRVVPGEALVIDSDLGIQRHGYWSAAEIQPRLLRAEEALEELDALLPAVMREHMRADVPFGLFLSGGLDSGVLGALLHAGGAGRIRSFSVGYRDSRLEHELAPAARLAEHFGFDHQPLELSPDALFARLVHSIWCADELMRDYATLPTSILAEHAGRELKVVFTGEGSDEVFAGYARYRPHPIERWWKARLAPGSGGFRARGQWSARWRRRLFGSALTEARPYERMPFHAAWSATPARWTDLQRRQYCDLVTALPDNLLVKTDRMLMGFGVEGRVPFLDHRLVEFALALPDALKVRDGAGKWLLRRWAESRLPPGHLDAPKRGFHVPVGDWLQGERATRIGALLARNEGIRRWFRPEAIPALVAARRAGHGGGRELFGLMQFAIWHRLFIERPGARPTPNEDPLEWIASD
ncbi:MAG: asparagine synthase (glutamine-hydrolyzing) [Chromatiaceae bacterium]|nr:asparagine synthase (glutamine-hydrolyzing) [Chromatiaceae bacterium]